MRTTRKLNRRSFVATVVGVAFVGGSGAHAQNTRYSGVTDCDSGNNHDRPGFGTGNRNQFTDSDTGPNADPRCHGRGSNTGGDSGTQYNPIEHPQSGCSDSDYGPDGDPPGRGFACRGATRDRNVPTPPHISGCTDNDTGSSADSVRNGRHCG